MESMAVVLRKEIRKQFENPFSKEDAIRHMDRAVEGSSAYAQDILDRIKDGKLEGSKWHAKRLAACVRAIDHMWRFSRPILAKEGKEDE
jgi:hypothetical protein